MLRQTLVTLALVSFLSSCGGSGEDPSTSPSTGSSGSSGSSSGSSGSGSSSGSSGSGSSGSGSSGSGSSGSGSSGSGSSSTGSTGTGSSVTDVESFYDTSTTSTDDIANYTVESDASVSATTATFNRNTNTITINGLAGTINNNRTRIDLDEGGTITLINAGTDYVIAYSAEPNSSDPFIGIVGLPTDTADIPSSGSATYSGNDTVVLQIIDGTNVYDLVGDADVFIDFGSNDVDIDLTELDGTRTNGVSAATNVSDAVDVSIDNADLSGSTFSGGSASLSNSSLATGLSGSEDVDLEGGIFGVEGDEVGGSLVIDDTGGTSTLRIQGTFVAD